MVGVLYLESSFLVLAIGLCQELRDVWGILKSKILDVGWDAGLYCGEGWGSCGCYPLPTEAFRW